MSSKSPPPKDSVEKQIEWLQRELAAAKARISELEQLAHVDELTGALNRRGFMRELRRAVSYSQRYGVPVALALFDLDGFKQVNDVFGHPAGDAVLAQTAAVLSRNLRASDVVARNGGDEFAVLLWHATETIAGEKMSALAQALAENPARWRDQDLPIRTSIGVHAIQPSDSVEACIEKADARLYANKSARRGGTVTR